MTFYTLLVEVQRDYENTDFLNAYLDIETTGLSWLDAEITVIGAYLVNGSDDRLVQLVGKEVTVDNLLKTVGDVNTIFTYNGSRFDLHLFAAHWG